MELVNEEVIALFAAWRAEIDTVPFLHETACDKVVHTLLDTPERLAVQTDGTTQ